MGLFYNRSGEEQAEIPLSPRLVSREERQIPKSATSLFLMRMSSKTRRLSSNQTPSTVNKKFPVRPTAGAVPGVDTDPNMTESSDASHDRCSMSRQSAKSRHRTTLSVDSMVESTLSDERDDQDSYERGGGYFHSPSSSYTSHSRTIMRRSKRRSKPSREEGLHSKITPDILPYYHTTKIQHMAPIFNPFANKGEVYLCEDMALVSDAMKLDLNTQIMLAYYDAKSLEDFCLIAEDDLKDMIVNARSMRRTLPPLQIRKIEVLHEWVKEISNPREDARRPSWIRFSQHRHSSRRRPKKLIPDDWKEQFRRDLPQLKHNLRQKGASLSGFSNFIPSFQSVNMCGTVT